MGISEKPPIKEAPLKIDHGWIFDADGVLFDAHDPKVKRPEITKFLFQRLKIGEPVAINSGRTVKFSLDKLLPGLTEMGVTDEMLERFTIVGEKGAVMTYFKDGDMHTDVDDTLSVPDNLRTKVYQLVKEEFGKTMFEGEMKSFLSPQKKGEEEGGSSIEEFHEDQKRLVELGSVLLKNLQLNDIIRIDPTSIATDFQHMKAGKAFGAQRIIEWMKEKRFLPQQIHCFGDSPSDQEMADEVHKEGFKVEFVWVGKKDKYEGSSLPYQVTIPEGLYDEATENYVTSFTTS